MSSLPLIGRLPFHRLAGAALVAALGGLLAASPSAGAPSRGGLPGFALSAVGGSYYRYDLRPGEAANGRLRLTSRSKRAQHVVVRPADVTTAADGGLEYGSEHPRNAGRWITVPRKVTVPAGGSVEVPFTVRVDRSAQPGDHLAGIVAVNTRDLDSAARKQSLRGYTLRYLPRLAIAVQMTVPGPATRELSAGGLTLDVSPSGTAVNVLLRNTGEKLIRRTSGTLVLSKGGRTLLEREVELGAFVPQTAIAYRLPLTGRPAEGGYRVVGQLRPEGADPVEIDDEVAFAEQQAEELRTETGREAAGGTPTWLLVALAAAGVLLLGLVYALLTTRRRLAARTS